MFDRLGDLLSEALEKGELPKSNISESENESNAQSIESTFSDFEFIKNKENSPHKTEQKPVSRPKINIPEEVRQALAFINIPEEADFDEAKKLYREKLMYYHPDRRNDNPVLQKVAKEKTAKLLKEWEKIENWYKSR